MRKLFSFIAAVLFAGSMMATSITITGASGFKSTYGTGDTFTVDEVEFWYRGVMYNGKGTPEASAAKSFIQLRKSGSGAGEIKNNTELSLKSIVVATQNDKDFTLSAGTAADALNAVTKPAGEAGTYAFTDKNGSDASCNVTVYTFNVTGMKYFDLLNGANASYIAYITIELADGETPPPTPVTNYYLVGSVIGWTAQDAYKLKANPGQDGEYMIEYTAAANEGLKVLGVQGETQTWYKDGTNNEYVVTEAGDYTIYFRPEGNEAWGYTYFELVKKEVPVLPVYTCAQVQANQATETGELNEVQVLFVNGGQFYVRDASGMTLIYKSNHGLAIGNLVSGIVGTSTLYNNVTPQFQPSNAAADWTITQGAAPVYDEKAVAPVATDINGVYNFKNVVFAEDVEFTTASKGSAVTATIGEENISIFNNYKKAYSFEANKVYDVVGVVTVYQNNPQIYFVSAAKHTTTAIDNAAVETKAIKTIENGKLVIIKNGVRYDALGTRL